MASLVGGPAWSLDGLQVAAGRYPLAVEQHVLRMVSLLVPGATTVTPHGRYYAVHALAAIETARHDLPPDRSFDLLRRMEVVLGAISAAHEDVGGHAGFPRPHGADVIWPCLRDGGFINVGELSVAGKGGYVQAQSGFWGPYVGSELLLGIVARGGAPSPGDRCDETAVRAGLGDLVDLARRDTLTRAELDDVSHLCLCAGGASPDGSWLRELLCHPPDDESNGKADRTRRATARLLARVVGSGTPHFTESFMVKVGFGGFVTTDAIASQLDEAEAWQGVVLRHYSVGAWRRLWAWLVDQVDDLTLSAALADTFAAHLPDMTVGQFVGALPSAMRQNGEPVAAEQQIRDAGGTLPAVELGVLVIGGRRAQQLAGKVGDAFRGRPVELGPEWVARRIEMNAARHLHDFGVLLIRDLLVRARRVAMSKMVRRPDGTIWLPTRLHEKGDFLWRTSREGSGDVGLRIAQLGTVLAGAGVFAWHADDGNGAWHLTDVGMEALG